MNWTTVSPALITGLVGVVGVAGSVWSAKFSSRSVDERDQVTVKRRLYAESYSIFSKAHQQLWRFKDALESGWSDQERSDAIARLYASKDSLIEATSELALVITSSQLQNTIVDAYDAFMDTLEACISGKTGTGAPSLNYLTELQHHVLDAMRRDIGTW